MPAAKPNRESDGSNKKARQAVDTESKEAGKQKAAMGSITSPNPEVATPLTGIKLSGMSPSEWLPFGAGSPTFSSPGDPSETFFSPRTTFAPYSPPVAEGMWASPTLVQYNDVPLPRNGTSRSALRNPLPSLARTLPSLFPDVPLASPAIATPEVDPAQNKEPEAASKK
jgi:hypothetical protein